MKQWLVEVVPLAGQLGGAGADVDSQIPKDLTAFQTQSKACLLKTSCVWVNTVSRNPQWLQCYSKQLSHLATWQLHENRNPIKPSNPNEKNNNRPPAVLSTGSHSNHSQVIARSPKVKFWRLSGNWTPSKLWSKLCPNVKLWSLPGSLGAPQFVLKEGCRWGRVRGLKRKPAGRRKTYGKVDERGCVGAKMYCTQSNSKYILKRKDP